MPEEAIDSVPVQKMVSGNMRWTQKIQVKDDYVLVPLVLSVSKLRENGTVTHIGKHWVAKVYTRGYEGETGSNGQLYYAHQDFIHQGMTDSFLCHIFHAANTLAPKGKFLHRDDKKLVYVSRLYPLDHYERSHQDTVRKGKSVSVRGKDLFHWLDNNLRSYNTHQCPVSRGLVESIVFNMIVDNWDHRLDNLSAHMVKDAAGNYYLHISPFDMTYSLQQEEHYHMKWNYEGFRSVVSGTDPQTGAHVGVATALLDTIADYGSRVTGHYRNRMQQPENKNWLDTVEDSRALMKAMIGRELDQENAGSHQEALLKVFDRVLLQINLHKDASRNWVKENIQKAVEPTLVAHHRQCSGVYARLTILHKKLSDNARDFIEFADNFRANVDVAEARPAKVRRLNIGGRGR